MLQRYKLSACSLSRLIYRFESKRLSHNFINEYDNLPWYKKIIEKYKLYTFADRSTAFDPVILRSAYKRDKINTKEWSIIYYDFSASRIGAVGSLVIAAITLSVSIGIADYCINGDITFQLLKRLKDDSEDFGVFIVIPVTLAIIVATVLLRLHQMRVFRIYQNIKNPSEYIMISPGIIKQYRRKKFNRSDVKTNNQFYDEMSYLHLIKSGTAKIKDKNMIIDAAEFRTQPLKAYMLNENSKIPDDLYKSPARTERSSISFLKQIATQQSTKKPPVPPPF